MLEILPEPILRQRSRSPIQVCRTQAVRGRRWPLVPASQSFYGVPDAG